MLTTDERLARLITTLKIINSVVMQFPVFPEPPLERHLIDENIDVIQTLVDYALSPNLEPGDIAEWDGVLVAIGEIEGAE